jgi:tape measure domain-containing protein
MPGNEWVIKVTADVKDVLDASRQIGQAGKTAGQSFQDGFNGNDKTLSGLRGRLNELNKTLDDSTIGSREFKKTQQEIAQAQQQVDKALGQTTTAATALSGVFSALGALGIGISAAGFLKGSIEKAMELETISQKLSNTLGKQGAAGALSFARDTADTLGLSFKDLANNFGSFTAAATAAGVPLQQQKDLFGAVAKAGQALGLSNDEISGSLLALQQVASKGTVSMEELRGQLGERLPIALAATAKGLGISQQELIKLVESGKLTSSEFFPAITKGLNDLTAGAGGVPTAAQNFAKLQNAWDDLQTSFGTSLLPIVTTGVKALAAALEGFKAESAAKDLKESFGFANNEAAQFAGQLDVIQKRYGLTNEQAKNLLSNAIENAGASRNWFGELNTGGGKFGKIQEGLVEEAMKFVAANKDQRTELNQIAAIETKRLQDAKTQNTEKAKELATEGQLTEAVRKTQKAQLDGQASVKQASLNLGQALINLEDSRFDIVRARNGYELQQAQKRGASEAELDEIRRRGEAIEIAALNTKYQGLVRQQGLQKELFALQQQQARLEADLTASNARLEVDKARLKVQAAELSGNKQAIDEANVSLRIAELGLNAATAKQGILGKIQTLEGQSAKANDEIARNGLRAKAEALGLQQAADGTFKAAKGTADAFESFGDSLKVPVRDQEKLARLAKDMGFAVKDTGKGYFEIGTTLKGSNLPPTEKIKGLMGTTANATKGASKEARGLGSNMDRAADAAVDFHNALAAAAGLPPARFAGGPVDAGQTYRINDGPSGMSLGQESFLSASGVLSLINRPLNSTWTAPSRGTVIPAGVTSRLKDAGALGGGAGVLRGGSDPAVAHLSLAVGNLSQEVAELRRKAWNVSVGVRGDGSGLRLAQTMARMR